MEGLKAFVGHSFDEKDSEVIGSFLTYLNTLSEPIGLKWDHAEKAEPKELSKKVREKMEGKDLFIGIFTKKDYRVEPDKMKPTITRKKRVSKSDCSWGTSDWIIQESGYALGKDIQLLFLVEEDVQITAGLQGDIEYIKFKREAPALSFGKINEMIGSILPEKERGPISEEKAVPPEDVMKDHVEQEKAEDRKVKVPSTFEKWMTSHRTLRRLIAKERKIAEAEKELTNIIDQYKGDPVFDAIYWQSSFYALKIRTGLSEDFEELEKLSEINPERTEPLDNLGSIYKKYERFSDAAKQYLKCAAIEKEKAREIIWIGSAAECYALDGSFKEAYDILLKEFDDSGLDSTHYHELYKNLAEVARIEKNDNLFTAFSEKALEYSPTDSSTRFSLAYRYSKIDKNAFALYHYKFLCEHSPNDTNWNNIGVAFEQLDMKYKSVSSYRKASEEYKGTLAMANLAYRHIDGGFLDDAAEILNNARSEKDYHENVDSALSKMHEIKRKEEELEATVLQDIEGEREFRAKFAEAYALPSKVNIDAEWESKHGKISLRVEGEKISGEGLILPVAPTPAKSRVGLFLGALSNLGIPERPFRKKSISLEGKVNNRAIVYQLAITTQLPDTAALGTTTELYEGLMCIAKDELTIEVMENFKDKKEIGFYNMKRIKDTPEA